MYSKGKKRLQELQCAVEALREEARTGLASNEVRRFAIKAELENDKLVRERAKAIVQFNRIENDKLLSATGHVASASTSNELVNKSDLVWAEGDYSAVNVNFFHEKEETLAPQVWSAKMLEYKSLCDVADECCTDVDKEEDNNRNTIHANEPHYKRNTVFLTEAEVKSDYMYNRGNSNDNNVYSSCKGNSFSASSKSKKVTNGSVITTQLKDCSLSLPELLHERHQAKRNMHTITFCPTCHACCIVAANSSDNTSFIDEKQNNNKKVECEVCGNALHKTNLVSTEVGKENLSMQTNNLQENVTLASRTVECATQHCNVCENWKQSLKGLLFMQ